MSDVERRLEALDRDRYSIAKNKYSVLYMCVPSQRLRAAAGFVEETRRWRCQQTEMGGYTASQPVAWRGDGQSCRGRMRYLGTRKLRGRYLSPSSPWRQAAGAQAVFAGEKPSIPQMRDALDLASISNTSSNP